MKKNNNIKRMSRKKWREAAAFLSGEQNHTDSIKSNPVPDEQLKKQWEDITMINRENNIDVENAWAKVSRRISTEEVKREAEVNRYLTPMFVRVAASILILIAIGFTAYRVSVPRQITIATSSSEKNITIPLPDGSIVWLNRNSSFTYPAKFRGKTRNVTLKGEGYFEIARNEAKPFIINAGRAEVKVLGTTFNVITDNGNNQVEVFVTSGSVMLTSLNGEENITLKPGLIGKISESGTTAAVNSNSNYLSWNTEKLVYNGETLGKVFCDLKRAYNIDVKTDDPGIKELTLTTVFEDQPHDTIIKVICTTFNLKYEKSGESYLIMPR
jgi:transmembrane sensor